MEFFSIPSFFHREGKAMKNCFNFILLIVVVFIGVHITKSVIYTDTTLQETFEEVETDTAVVVTPEPVMGQNLATVTDAATEELEEKLILPPTPSYIIEKMDAIGNDDVKAWIRVPGVHFDAPVLQSKDCNSYYLERDEYGQERRSGSIIFDYAADLETAEAVIYGHNMRDGSGITPITQFYYDYEGTVSELNGNKIYIHTREGMYIYTIFAVRLADADDSCYAMEEESESFELGSDTYKEMLDYSVKNASFLDSETAAQVTPESRTLTLSTCFHRQDGDEGRLLIQAVLQNK
jgi:sortase B